MLIVLGGKHMDNKKIMIVNDIAGVGKVAANVVSPILSAAELEPTTLPTLLLSSNADAAAGKVITLSTQEIFTKYLVHWDQLGFDFSAYVTGYFADSKQITQFKEYFLKNKRKDPSKKLFVDPTMGESGKLYSGFNEDIPNQLSQLIEYADIAKPNVTEACYLTGHPYKENMDVDELTELAHKVNQLGAKNTVLTGIRDYDENGKELIGFLYYDENDHSGIILHEYFDRDFFGTGDIVFSLMTSFYLAGYSIEGALKETGDLVQTALRNTKNDGRSKRYGVYFESILHEFHERLYS